MTESLFPLKMTSIEKLHFFDDWPEFPNNIFARCRFRGELQPQLAEQALLISAARHVWANALVARSGGSLQWQTDLQNRPQFLWLGSEPYRFEPIDLTRGPVCRMTARRTGVEFCEVTFQVHHAVVDGLGGLQFLRDWLIVYDNLVSGRDPEHQLPKIQTELIHRRNHLGLIRWEYLWKGWRQLIGLFGAAKFLFRPFARLGDPGCEGHRGVRPDTFPSYVGFSWTAEELRRIRSFVRSRKLGLNDWLLAGVFSALSEWNQKEFGRSLPGHSRLIVPINLRTADDREMPAANRASLVQIDREVGTGSNLRELAGGIQYELSLIRDWQLDRTFLILVRGFSISESWLRRMVSRHRPRATSMLTNVGKPMWRLGLPMEHGKVNAGGLVLEELDVVGPIRFGMPVSFAVLEYAGCLRMTAHFDSALISQQSAVRLGELIRDRVNRIDEMTS